MREVVLRNLGSRWRRLNLLSRGLNCLSNNSNGTDFGTHVTRPVRGVANGPGKSPFKSPRHLTRFGSRIRVGISRNPAILVSRGILAVSVSRSRGMSSSKTRDRKRGVAGSSYGPFLNTHNTFCRGRTGDELRTNRRLLPMGLVLNIQIQSKSLGLLFRGDSDLLKNGVNKVSSFVDPVGVVASQLDQTSPLGSTDGQLR